MNKFWTSRPGIDWTEGRRACALTVGAHACLPSFQLKPDQLAQNLLIVRGCYVVLFKSFVVHYIERACQQGINMVLPEAKSFLNLGFTDLMKHCVLLTGHRGKIALYKKKAQLCAIFW